MKKNEAMELMDKYLGGNATPEEKVLFERLYNRVLKKRLQDGNQLDYTALKAALDKKLVEPDRKPVAKRLSPYTVAASIALFIIAATAAYMFTKPEQHTEYTQTDIAPGGNKATLTLTDGRTIELSEAQSGIIIDGKRITYSDASAEIADLQPNSVNKLVLNTPKGGQYQVTLPDGTKVWLNAASSLTYPASFASLKERRVILTGEGYFEVAPDKAVPFRVETPNQEIEVVGTHFNVNSYSDEPLEKTTLMEGAVKVTKGNSSRLLKPGQEAAIKESIHVVDVDVSATLAWKNGEFVFNDEPLESIMRKVARWYDVEVVYDGVDIYEEYGGSVSRYDNVSKVLKKLELTGGIHFKIEGRRITAMK